MNDPSIDALIERLTRAGAFAKLAQEFYAEGTWTPAFAGSATPGTITYTKQYGAYQRIGAMVWITAYLTINAVSVAPTGNATITGLPFAARTVADEFAALSVGQYGGFSGQVLARTSSGSSTITLVIANTAVAATELTAGDLLILSGWYPIA